MTAGTTLRAMQINHGRSEIWLEGDGKELTGRRNIATNEVVNVARRYCAPEVFDIFYKEYMRAMKKIVELDAPNLKEIASELKLEISE